VSSTVVVIVKVGVVERPWLPPSSTFTGSDWSIPVQVLISTLAKLVPAIVTTTSLAPKAGATRYQISASVIAPFCWRATLVNATPP